LLKVLGVLLLTGAVVEGASIWKRSASATPNEIFGGMKEFSANIKKRLARADNQMADIANTLKENLKEVISITEYIDENQQDQIKTTLATLEDLTKRMNFLRAQLFTLAEGTVRKVNQLIRFLTKFRDGGELGKDYKTCLVLMKQLLQRSLNVLEKAEIEIEQISKEMSITQANIVVFQGFVKQAKRKAEQAAVIGQGNSTKQITAKSVDIAKNVLESLSDGKYNTGANSSWADLAHGILKSLPSVVQLSSVITQYQKLPDLGAKFDDILEDIEVVVEKVKLESGNIEKERALVFKWKTAVIEVRQSWVEESDDLEVENLDEGLVEVIIEDFTELKDVAELYIAHINDIWPKAKE